MTTTSLLHDNGATETWPALPQSAWSATCATLQLWMQVVGKIRLALMPPINHSWNVTLYPTVRGVTTAPMPCAERILQIDFDFVDHVLILEVCGTGRRTVTLRPMPVAEFYSSTMAALVELGTPVKIWPVPAEIAQPVRFDQDQIHDAYDREYVERFWRILLQTARVFTAFRARFTGKVSPVHLFWGRLI